MKKSLVIGIVVFCLAVNVFAEETALEAIKESYRRYHEIESERVNITVTDGKGDVKRMVWQAAYDFMGETGHDIEMSIFTEPELDRGFKVFIERSDELHYDRIVVKRPSHHKPRIISGRNEAKSYAGDFNFQDAREATRVKFDDYDWSWEDTAEGRVIVQVSKKGTQTLYSKKRYWLDGQYRMVKIEHYDSRGRLWKVWENLLFDPDIRGEAWRVQTFTMQDLIRKRKTKIEFNNRIVNFKVKNSMFDEKTFFAR